MRVRPWPVLCVCFALSGSLAAPQQQPDAKALFEVARKLYQAGDQEKAIHAYRKVLEVDADFLPALDDLAWILATAPDERLRNPAEAERLAARLVNLTHFKLRRATGQEFTPMYKVHTAHTLAAAFAAKGDYKSAVECAQSSVETAAQLNRSGGAADLLSESRMYLELYQQNHSFVAPKDFRRTPVDVH